MRSTLAGLLLVTACSGDQPIVRLYDTRVNCVPSSRTEALERVEAIDRLDQDGDRRLTENDLHVGEATALARVSGDYLDSTNERPEGEGFATHSDWSPVIRSMGDEVYEMEMRLNCRPTVVTAVSFRAPAAWSGERSTAEILDFIFFAFDAPVRNAPGTATIEGTLDIERSEGGMSGAFDGVIEAPLLAWEIPEELLYEVSEVTGQVGEVHPFAFRDLPVAP